MSNYAHVVYRPMPNGKLREIDTVFASYKDPDEMRRSLIGHDGYPSNIVVVCNRQKAEG
jgi:hypothetical protein